MSHWLKNIEFVYPGLTKLYSTGNSVQGSDLLVLEVTQKNNDLSLLKPNVKLVSGIHGNQPVGKEVILHFILYLVQNYKNDVTVRYCIKSCLPFC